MYSPVRRLLVPLGGVWLAACTGSPPYLVTTAQEAAGPNCAAGGVEVSTGPDANENGLLDADEVVSTDYVCGGADGADGPEGLSGDPGAEGNPGATGATGAAGTEGQGGFTHYGHAYIESGDVEAFQEVERITGDLVVVAYDIEVLDLPHLKRVDGLLRLEGVGAGGLDLPALTHVGGLRLEFASGLTSLDGISALTAVDGPLWMWDNEGLTSLDGLDNLTTLPDELWIEDNPALTSLHALDGVTAIGGALIVRSNAALPSLAGLDAVTAVGGSVTIEANALLSDYSGLGSIADIGDAVLIHDNSSTCVTLGLAAELRRASAASDGTTAFEGLDFIDPLCPEVL